jgi:hypothetical protein
VSFQQLIGPGVTAIEARSLLLSQMDVEFFRVQRQLNFWNDTRFWVGIEAGDPVTGDVGVPAGHARWEGYSPQAVVDIITTYTVLYDLYRIKPIQKAFDAALPIAKARHAAALAQSKGVNPTITADKYAIPLHSAEADVVNRADNNMGWWVLGALGLAAAAFGLVYVSQSGAASNPVKRPDHVWLKGVGWVKGKPAGTIRPGDRLAWNYGSTSVVEHVEQVSAQFVSIRERIEDGQLFDRRLKVDRLVALASSALNPRR